MAVPWLISTDGMVDCDDAGLRLAAEDFGHLVHHPPRAVLRPSTIADVAAIVAFAGEAGLNVAARGAGHSSYGQAQSSGGIVLDMSGLSLVSELHADRVTVQAGALWSAVLEATLAGGTTPAVLTDYLHTSVGGTLAAGGVGGTSHRWGFQVDTVLDLRVITGTGRLVTCSPQRNRELFDAIRAGLGQCGITVSATLGVIPAPARVRRYRLYYHDLATFLEDQRHLVLRSRFDFLQGQIVLVAPGTWRYFVEAAAYHTPLPVPADAALLEGLDDDRAAREIDDLPYREFAHRLDTGEATLRVSGEWLHPHPWLTSFLPAQTAAALVGEVLASNI
ncbi:MAG: FAD-binding protein, partial [Pseudonocardiaceae bacterium]